VHDARNEVHRLEDDVRGAITSRRFELVTHMAMTQIRQQGPLFGLRGLHAHHSFGSRAPSAASRSLSNTAPRVVLRNGSRYSLGNVHQVTIGPRLRRPSRLARSNPNPSSAAPPVAGLVRALSLTDRPSESALESVPNDKEAGCHTQKLVRQLQALCCSHLQQPWSWLLTTAPQHRPAPMCHQLPVVGPRETNSQ
jgi:hypothetical protein